MVIGVMSEENRQYYKQLNLCSVNGWFTARMVWMAADGRLKDISTYLIAEPKEDEKENKTQIDESERMLRYMAAMSGGGS